MATAIPLWINAGTISRTGSGDDLAVNSIIPQSATALSIGASVATSVVLGDMTLDLSGGLDLTSSGTASLLDSNATGIDFGGGVTTGTISIGDSITSGKVQIDDVKVTGSSIDANTSGALNIGTTATTTSVVVDDLTFTGVNIDGSGDITIGASTADSVQIDGLKVTGNTLDVAAAGVLTIGGAGSVATQIDIGTTGEETRVLGNLQVLGNESVAGTATFTGPTITFGDDPGDVVIFTASVDSDVNFLGPQNLTTSSGDMNLIAEGTTIVQGGLGVALTGTLGVTAASPTVTTSADLTSELNVGDAVEIVSSGGTEIFTVTAVTGANFTIDSNSTYTDAAATGTTDDNLFSVVTGDLATRLNVTKTGGLELTYGETQGSAITMTNADDSISANIIVSAGAPTAAVSDGSMALDTTNGDIYVRKSSAWSLLTTSAGSTLQAAYDAGQTITLNDSPAGDMVITVDETGTEADFTVKGANNYFTTDANGLEAQVGSSGVQAALFSPTVAIGTNDAGVNYMMTVVAPASAMTTYANTHTYQTSAAAKTITGNGTNGITFANTTAPLTVQTTTGLLTITTTSGNIDIAPTTTGDVFVQNASNEGLQIEDTGAITINAGAANLSIHDGSGIAGFSMDGTGTVALDNSGVGDKSIGFAAGDDLNLQAALNTTGTGAINLGTSAADQVNVGTSGGNEPAIDINGSTVAIDGSTSISIGTTADLPIDIDASTFDLDASGDITIDSSGAGDTIAITATGAGAVDAITLATVTSGDIAVNSVAGVDVDGTVVAIDGSTSVSIGGTAGTTIYTDGTNVGIGTAAGTLADTEYSVEVKALSTATAADEGKILLLTNDQAAAASAGVQTYSVNPDGVLDANQAGDICLSNNGNLYVATAAGTGNWEPVQLGTDTSTLQEAYNNQGATPVQLLTNDWTIEIDDSAANWVVSNEAGTSDYIATNFTNNSLDLGSAAGKEVHFLGNVGTDIVFDSAARNITNDSANLTLRTTTSGTLAVNSVAALDMDGTTVTLDGTNGVSIAGSGAASDFTSTSQNLTIATATSGTLFATSAGLLDMEGGAGFNLDGAGAASTITSTSQNLTISTATSGTLAVNSVAALDMDGTVVTLDGSTSVDVTSAGALDMDGTVVTLDGSTSVAIDSAATTLLDSATGTTVSADAGGVTIDATAGNIAITAPAASDVNITATSNAASDVNFSAHGLTIPFNATTSTSLDTTAQDIIGALNELKGESSDMVITYNAAVDIDFGEAVYMTSTGTVGLTESATNARFIGISVSAGTVTTGNPVDVAVGGEVRVEPDVVGTPDEGKYVYLSSTGGALTCTAPGSGTILRVGILTNATASAMTMVVQPGTPVSL